MVQTEAQYKFVYLALQRYIQGEQLRLREQVGAGPGRGGAGPATEPGGLIGRSSSLFLFSPFLSGLFPSNRSKILKLLLNQSNIFTVEPVGRRECVLRVHSFFHSLAAGSFISFVTCYWSNYDTAVAAQPLQEGTGFRTGRDQFKANLARVRGHLEGVACNARQRRLAGCVMSQLKSMRSRNCKTSMYSVNGCLHSPCL